MLSGKQLNQFPSISLVREFFFGVHVEDAHILTVRHVHEKQGGSKHGCIVATQMSFRRSAKCSTPFFRDQGFHVFLIFGRHLNFEKPLHSLQRAFMKRRYTDRTSCGHVCHEFGPSVRVWSTVFSRPQTKTLLSSCRPPSSVLSPSSRASDLPGPVQAKGSR
mgnify:CR=1 FL=1